MSEAELEVDRRKKIVLSLVQKEQTIAGIIEKYPQFSERELNEWETRFLQAGEIAISKHSSLRSLGDRIKTVLLWILFALAMASIAWAVYITFVDYPYKSVAAESENKPSWTKAAEQGQFWEGHLAAGGTLAGTFLLFLAVMLQHEELKEQRKELQLARDVSERQLTSSQEAALVTQVLQCAQLRFETERRQLLDEVATKRRDPYEILDLEVKQLSQLERVSKKLFERHHLPDDLLKVLRVLASDEPEA